MDLPTESDIADILVALQGTQHDKISTKNLIREKYRTAQDPSDLDNLSGIGPKSKPLHVLEDEYFKSHCNTQHLSERYTLVSSIYGLSANEPLPSNLTTQIPTTSKPSFLWPSRDHQKGNASKEEQDALKQIKESILDLPVIISTVHETEKKGFGLLARWYWELKHYALMEGKRKRKQSADETSVIDLLHRDSIAFDISYSPDQTKKTPNSSKRTLMFRTRHVGYVVVVKVISNFPITQEQGPSIIFDHHLPKSFAAFNQMSSDECAKENLESTNKQQKSTPTITAFIKDVVWPEINDEFCKD